MDRGNKVAWREEITQSLDKSSALFIAQYSGMTVEDLTGLRRSLRAANAEFKVVKNTIMKKAFVDRKETALGAGLKGQIGVVYVYGDVAAAAKAVSETAKKNDKFIPVSGFMDSEVLTRSHIERLASLPSRDVLVASILASIVAPHKGLLGVLNGVPRALVSVLNQIKETKSAESTESA